MKTGQIISGSKAPFTQIPNDFIRNPEITAKAKGLMCYLWSNRDDWVLYKSTLTNYFKDGLASLRSAWDELEKLGYILSVDIRNEKGHIKGKNYILYHEPYNGLTDVGKPHIGKPNIGESQPRNTITKNTITKIKNKKKVFVLDNYKTTLKEFETLWREVVTIVNGKKRIKTPIEDIVFHLTNKDITNFNKLAVTYTKEEFREALRGMFGQKEIYKFLLNTPKHFLIEKNFINYLSAYRNKEPNLYSINKPKSRQQYL